ncbi:hypothetical protein KY389_10980 [Paracoccus bogoriensis]|nr:hypothetical protein [Paracoccus bogoriensis]
MQKENRYVPFLIVQGRQGAARLRVLSAACRDDRDVLHLLRPRGRPRLCNLCRLRGTLVPPACRNDGGSAIMQIARRRWSPFGAGSALWRKAWRPKN